MSVRVLSRDSWESSLIDRVKIYIHEYVSSVPKVDIETWKSRLDRSELLEIRTEKVMAMTFSWDRSLWVFFFLISETIDFDKRNNCKHSQRDRKIVQRPSRIRHKVYLHLGRFRKLLGHPVCLLRPLIKSSMIAWNCYMYQLVHSVWRIESKGKRVKSCWWSIRIKYL